MDDQLGLFGDSPPPAVRGVGPVQPTPDEEALARALPPGVHLGTSSWSFPGWAGLVYDREASKSILAREGLRAYAEHPLMGTVGLDRTYYRSLEIRDFRAYADQLPEGFRMLVKADRMVTAPLDPDSAAIRTRNPYFLDAEWATEVVVNPMREGLGDHLGPVLFQFSPFPASLVDGPDAFAHRLGRFLAALPRGPLYAVELRTPALLTGRYAQALGSVGAAHAYTVHSSMAGLPDQVGLLPPADQPALVVRWMLHAGLRYEAARERFAPFRELVDPDPMSRSTIAAAVRAAVVAGREAFVIVNNKAEGSSPRSVTELARALVG